MSGHKKNIGINKAALHIVSLLGLLISWQLLAVIIYYTRGTRFPGPLDVMSRLYLLINGETLYEHSIYEHLGQSLFRWGIGYAIALFLGIPIGTLMGAYPALYRLWMPAIYTLQMIPGLALLPIAMLIFGIGTCSTIFMITLMALPPIVINTAGGIRKVPECYLASAALMGARFHDVFFHILLPASLLDIINGLRIGMGSAWRVLVAAEMIVGVDVGLGYAIIQSRWSLDFESAFVSIMIIVIIGMSIEFIFFHRIEQMIAKKIGLRHA